MSRQNLIGVLCVSGWLVCTTCCGGRIVTSPGPSRIQGRVADGISFFADESVFVPGMSAQVLDGPLSGQTAETDAQGRFEFTGTATGSVTVQLTKAGFVTARRKLTWSPTSNSASTNVWVSRDGTLQIDPGTYDMTLTFDPARSESGAAPCGGYPADLVTRAYSATITRQFEVGDPFRAVALTAPGVSAIPLGLAVSGQAAALFDDNGIWETLPDLRYLTITASPRSDLPATSSGSTITIPFGSSFEYCRLTSPMGSLNNCFTTPASQRVEYHQCFDRQATLSLTRR